MLLKHGPEIKKTVRTPRWWCKTRRSEVVRREEMARSTLEGGLNWRNHNTTGLKAFAAPAWSQQGALNRGLPVLVNLWLPSLFELLISLCSRLRLPNLELDPLSCSQNLALQIETTTLLGVVEIEQLLESFGSLLQICLTSLWRADVQNSTCLVEGKTC